MAALACHTFAADVERPQRNCRKQADPDCKQAEDELHIADDVRHDNERGDVTRPDEEQHCPIHHVAVGLVVGMRFRGA